MRILLDENLPRKLLAALRQLGHEVESVHTLRLDGIDNGALFQLALRDFDLCFTRDAEFAERIKQSGTIVRLKLLRVTIPQQGQDNFVNQFIEAFRLSDWTNYQGGDDWP